MSARTPPQDFFGAHEPPQLVNATVSYNGQTIKNAQLTVPYDLTEQGLPVALKKVLDLPEDKEIDIKRYSKSSDSYILLNDKAQFDAIFRSLKVKHKFSFQVTGK